MGLFTMRRVPEPELMAPEEEEAYQAAVTSAYLGGVDDSFVAEVLSLHSGPGTLLDVGTGVGQIAAKIAKRNTSSIVVWYSGLVCLDNLSPVLRSRK